MHAIGAAQQRDVDVVVDYQQRVGNQGTQLAGQGEQLAAAQGLVAQLHDLGASARRSGDDFDHAFTRSVGCDHVKPREPQPALRATFPAARGRVLVQLRIWRSFSRKAFGAVSQSHECLTRRFKWSWNS